MRKKGRSRGSRKKAMKQVPAQVLTREEPERPEPMKEKHQRPIPSREILDWLVDPKRNFEEALPMAVDLLWATDGEQWETWEQQHHPASLFDLAAVVINYLAADMGMPPQVRFPSGGATPTPLPQAVGTSTPGSRGELHQSPVTEREPHQSPVTEGEPYQSPVTEREPHQSPVTEREPHQSPVTEGEPHQPPEIGDYLLLPPPPLEGD
ncbi:UNVERIFIED_CONTAM: hypothetical protein FKN15_050266 [Acipenser sinensis]